MIVMKVGDTAPPVRAVLLDADNTPVDLTDSTVRFILATKGPTRSVAVDQPATVTQTGDGSDGTRGTVTYQWGDNDTATAGLYDAEFEVVFADNRVQTFPTDGYLDAKIVDDLGGTR